MLRRIIVQQFRQIDVETFSNGDWHIVVGGNIYVSFQMSMSSVYCILLRRCITEIERYGSFFFLLCLLCFAQEDRSPPSAGGRDVVGLVFPTRPHLFSNSIKVGRETFRG